MTHTPGRDCESFPLQENDSRLRLHCTIFCKHVNASADIRHTNPLQCSEFKIFECKKKLAHVKKLVD